MKWNSLLKETGFTKLGDGYKNPETGKKVSRASALERASKVLGYKNYSEAKFAFNSRAYKRITGFAKENGKKNDVTLNKLFAKAWADRNKKTKGNKPAKSHNLTKLLKHVGKLPKQYRNPYGNPL